MVRGIESNPETVRNEPCVVICISCRYMSLLSGVLFCRSSPPLGVISVASFFGEVLVPAARVDILTRLHAGSQRVLLEIGYVVRSVASLQDRVGGRRLLLSFPEEMVMERLGQLGCQHVAARCAR